MQNFLVFALKIVRKLHQKAEKMCTSYNKKMKNTITVLLLFCTNAVTLPLMAVFQHVRPTKAVVDNGPTN